MTILATCFTTPFIEYLSAGPTWPKPPCAHRQSRAFGRSERFAASRPSLPRGDHQPSPSAGAAGGGDRLGLSGGTVRLGVSAGTGAAAVADPAGSRAVHSQAYAQPLRRGAVRAMGGEPVFPVLLWGSGVPARAAI